MRSILIVSALVLGCLSGCGRSADERPTTAYKPPPVLHKWAMAEDTAPIQPAADTKAVAEQLAKALADEDVAVRQEASRQFQELGEAGYPHLLAALKNPRTRLAALEGLSPPLVDQHQKELVPLLLETLRDKDPAVRMQVCDMLTWVDRPLEGDEIQAGVMIRERMAALRLLADRDESREVQDMAKGRLVSLRDAALGRIGAGEPEPTGEGGLSGTGARDPNRPAPKRELRP